MLLQREPNSSCLLLKGRPLIVAAVLILAAGDRSQCARAALADEPPHRPNILVILADDLGYADVGFNGCKDIPTPHLDALAKRSTRCTAGYVSHPFCSPTRAGLLTGRYQQRFGHENNPKWDPTSTVLGLPIDQTTLPQVMKTAGYTTGCIGKWHLGAHPQFHPNRRGFDEYFGLLGGGHAYLPAAKGGAEYSIPLNRNGRDEPLQGHLTDLLGREAAAFVRKQQGKPWFCYLAFNAPHTPLQPTDEQLKRLTHIEDETRRKYAGLIIGLDDALGVVLDELQATGQQENTLVWFFSDNGNPTPVSHGSNAPLRGDKGQVYDGGMHTPFLVSWPARLPQGVDYAKPVISLDVFATAVAVGGAKLPEGCKPEGVDLVPFLSGEQPSAPHDRLYWRTGGGAKWAVREGDWKLVREEEGPPQLFNLADDVGESRNLASAQPEVVARLSAAYEAWNKDNVTPLFENPRPTPRKK